MSWLLPLSAASALAAQTAIARIARGDRAALRALYDECAGRALALAARVLGSAAEAEDVVQETFLDIWRRGPDLEKERGAPGPWVGAVARSRAIERRRARQRPGGTAQGPASEAQRQSEPPAVSADRWQERERVRTALKTLPDEARRAIELAYFSGLTQTEIAEKLGQPLETVKTDLRTAMEKLAAMLVETR